MPPALRLSACPVQSSTGKAQHKGSGMYVVLALNSRVEHDKKRKLQLVSTRC